MRWPWYVYPLLFIGCIALLNALLGPMFGAAGTPPGAIALGLEHTLVVQPGSPLERAGVRSGDRFLHGGSVELGGLVRREARPLQWTGDIPHSGLLELRRGGRTFSVEVQPAPQRWPVRLAWSLLRLLNIGLAVLALALLWQRPRDRAALLLAAVLMAAPVFALSGGPRLFALALGAHFFVIFPPPPELGRLRVRTLVALYLPAALFGIIGGSLFDHGRPRASAAVFDLVAVGYGLFCLLKVASRWRGSDADAEPVYRTLAVAAGAIMAAVLAGISQRLWLIWDQFVPANLVPAAIFSGAVAHLVFRLRALEVRVMARRTVQYLLARWTLGTLFLIPGFMLVWRFGQLSVTHSAGRPQDVLPYLVWMFVVAILLGKRQEVLQKLDRRFFRDAGAARQALIRLAQELGACTEPEAVLTTLESGIRGALAPVWLRFSLPDIPPDPEAEVVRVHRGEMILGHLQLGPKQSHEPYTGEERELMDAAAVQAATTIENARLNAALLAQQREELTVRTAGVLSGAEEERRRLAADLHDQVLPELRHIAGEVDRLKRHANGLSPDLDRLGTDVRAAMDSVREVMEALRPSALDMLGLGDALESYLRKGAARLDSGITVSVRRSGPEPELTADQSLALYRICQEAINNVLKHSGCRHAGLEIANTPEALSLLIWDDGCGLPEEPKGSGHGLGNIRYRADMIGARVEWRARMNGGTEVEVVLPFASSFRESAAEGQYR